LPATFAEGAAVPAEILENRTLADGKSMILRKRGCN
jgi:hypothetical protein